jgi:hypothetical protein
MGKKGLEKRADEIDDSYPDWQTLIHEMEPSEREALFKRVRESESTAEDHSLFDAMMMMKFCEQAYSGKPVDDWILNAVSNRFTKILCGGEWHAEFNLPWLLAEPIRTDIEERELKIYVAIRQMQDDSLATSGKRLKVTDAITRVAGEFNISYESARAGYYKINKIILKNSGDS